MTVEKDKISILGFTKSEIVSLMVSLGEKPFRAKQLWNWIYVRGVKDFAEMDNLPITLRDELAANYSIARPVAVESLISADATRKWLLSMQDGKQIETVFIPDLNDIRGALCVSSQVGCTLSCSFCHTGTMQLVRNLTAEEIVGQWLLAKDELAEWPPNQHNSTLTNIVVMGMGEPLFNYRNVAKALKILMDNEGMDISKRRITLSTSGVVPAIEICGYDLGVNLAISLHAVTDELRNELVPLNKKYPLKQLLAACRNYPAASNSRRITFEYVMLKDVNDSDADARELVRLLKDIPAKVNLIPWNPWPGSKYETSSNNRIRAFAEIVNNAGYSSPVRAPRGRDIFAACGQLKSASQRGRRERVKL